MASAAVTELQTSETAVRQLLQRLFAKQDVAVSTEAATTTAAADDAAGVPTLQLHPHVDAAHPLGTAHSAKELEAALKLYSQTATSMAIEVDDVLLGQDKTLATGHLVALSHLSSLALSAGGPALSATTAVLPSSLRSLLTDTVMPAGLRAARVPITIQMRLGKNDAGDAVVTHMSLVFSLLSVLLPHVELNPWQQEKLQQSTPALLSLLQQMGAAATVAEDTMTSIGASWRAGSAVVQATVGQVLSAGAGQIRSMWASRSAAGGVEQ